jgi:hypothetical protein
MPNPPKTAPNPADLPALPRLATILLATPVTTQVLVGAYLLRQYGDRKYRGASLANLAVATPEQLKQPAAELARGGFALVRSAADVVAELEIARLPEIQQLLEWATSQHPADDQARAFHLAALVEQYIRTHQQELTPLLTVVFPLLDAHLQKERRTFYDLPQEWADAQKANRVQEYDLEHNGGTLHTVVVRSTAPDLPGYLHENRKVKADLVLQEVQPGSLIASAAPGKQIRLDDLARILRIEELRRRGQDTTQLAEIQSQSLAEEGRWESVTSWWYDRAGGRLLGGPITGDPLAPATNEPTLLTLEDLLNAAFIGLSNSVWEKGDQDACRGPGCYFFDYYLPRCQRRMQQAANL